VFSLFSAMSSSHQKNGERSYELQTTAIVDRVNHSELLAKLEINKHGKIIEISVGTPLLSKQSQDDLIEKANRWITEADGHVIWLRPMFSHLPLKGAFRWKDVFRIRPVSDQSKIGKGLSFPDLHPLSSKPEAHLGPPFPFILEVSVPKSVDGLLENRAGIKILNRYEALLSVLLTPNLTTARMMQKQWTTIWDGEKYSYHLLNAGFDINEDGRQKTFSEVDLGNVPNFSGEDYFNHLWIRDIEINLPPNLPDLLEQYSALSKPVRRHFDRACYWFSLGLENQKNPPISIVAFSNAIECLLPRKSTVKCETCGSPKGKGPTKLFFDHLEKYAPIPESLEPDRKKLYGIRSALVHGSRLEDVDIDWLSPLRTDDDNNLLISILARRSLVNWLADSQRTDPTVSTTHQST
jgi:hypothetical protein